VRRKIKILLAESAVEDIEAIRNRYVDQSAHDAGERLIRNIIATVEKLADLPDRGRRVPEFRGSNLREIIKPPFRIVYRRDPACVHVIRIWRSERLLRLP